MDIAFKEKVKNFYDLIKMAQFYLDGGILHKAEDCLIDADMARDDAIRTKARLPQDPLFADMSEVVRKMRRALAANKK